MSWEKVKLSDIAIISAGQSAPKENDFNESNGLPFIRAGHLERLCEGSSLINLPKITTTSASKNKLKAIGNGSILFAKSGMSATLNRVYLLLEDAYYVSHLASVSPNEKLINPSYLFYYLKQYQPSKLIKDSAYPSIGLPDIGNIAVPLPPLPIQKQIAAILDAADALRRKDQELLKKYDELAQAIFIDMFGENVDHVKLRDITTKVTDGVHAKPNYTFTGVPFLSVKNVTNKVVDFNECKFISEEDHIKYCSRCKPELEDILYTKVGATYGRSAIVETKNEFSIYVSLALIKPNRERVYPYYLNFVMNSQYVKRQADRRVKGAGVPDLHLVEIKDFDIPLPSMAKQLSFSNAINKFNTISTTIKKQIISSDALFQSLLQKAFKGELVKEEELV